MIKMWLDDTRDPKDYGYDDWRWVKNYDQAVKLLKTGKVAIASLDHDLADEHYDFGVNPSEYREKTGYDVVCWMEENNVWPPNGVNVHSMNPIGRARMEQVIRKHYRGEK